MEKHIPAEYSYVSTPSSYIKVRFHVTHNGNDKKPYDDYDETWLVKFGSIAFFSWEKLTTNSNKHLENDENFRTASLMNKFLPSSGGTIETIYAFDSSLTNEKNELTSNKQPGSKDYLRQISINWYVWFCLPILLL